MEVALPTRQEQATPMEVAIPTLINRARDQPAAFPPLFNPPRPGVPKATYILPWVVRELLVETRDDVIVETKWDGWRIIIDFTGTGQVRVRSKTGPMNGKTTLMIEQHFAGTQFPAGSLDCEAVVLGGQSTDVPSSWARGSGITVIVFDFIESSRTWGVWPANRPSLVFRRAQLGELSGMFPPWFRVSAELATWNRTTPRSAMQRLMRGVLARGEEGIMLKLPHASYPNVVSSRDRCDTWVKLRPDQFGSCLHLRVMAYSNSRYVMAAKDDRGALYYAGKAECFSSAKDPPIVLGGAAPRSWVGPTEPHWKWVLRPTVVRVKCDYRLQTTKDGHIALRFGRFRVDNGSGELEVDHISTLQQTAIKRSMDNMFETSKPEPFRLYDP